MTAPALSNFASEGSTCMHVVFKQVSVFLKSASRVYGLI